MAEQKETLVLKNPTGDQRIAQVLTYIGHIAYRITDPEDEGYVEYELPYPDDQEEGLAIMGDDALGAVTGAYNVGNDLRLIAHYGDDGTSEYSMLGEFGHWANDNPDIYVIKKLRWL